MFCFPPPMRILILHLHILSSFILPASTSFIRLLQKLSSVLLRTTTAFLNFYFGFIVKNDELPFLVFRIICSFFFFHNSHVGDFFFSFLQNLQTKTKSYSDLVFSTDRMYNGLSPHCPFGYCSFSEPNIWVASGCAKLPDQYPESRWHLSCKALLE